MVSSLRAGLTGLLGLAALPAVQGFYIPGWSIRSYKENEPIPLLVNKVLSDSSELQYAYYDLPFVCPPQGRQHVGEGLLSGQSIPLNLGEILRGDRIIASDMELEMGRDTPCQVLCNRTLSRYDVTRARELIADGYVVEWIVDNLPGATSFVTADKKRKYYAAGFKLGYMDRSHGDDHSRYFLHNHHTVVIRYRRAGGRAGDRGEKIIVGFEVYPKSIGIENKRDQRGCPADLKTIDKPFELFPPKNKTIELGVREFPDLDSRDGLEEEEVGMMIEVPYTYSVYFREDEEIEWSHRWDLYFVNQGDASHIHWLAITNSVIICGLLTGIVMIILARTVRSDIKGYRDAAAEGGKLRANRSSRKEGAPGLLDQGDALGDGGDLSDDEDEMLEDITGWKLLHGEVFRTPAYGALLAPLVGSGMQLLVVAIGLVLLSAVGVLNPSYRGGFISVGAGLFIFAGVFSGYFSARTYKNFDGRDYRRNAYMTALLFPGLTFSLVFVLNFFVWAQASSTAIPFGTLLLLLVLWLCVQVPLVYAGSHYGFVKASGWEHPTKTASIARQIPAQPWYMRPVASVLLAGLIPFGVIFIELLYVFQSLWQDKSGYYYLFGFMAVVSAILMVSIAEVTVVTVYMQLCAENYNWWWQSFFVGGGCAVWVFGYSVYYYMTKLHITGFVSGMLFFAYSFMACCMFGLLTGTVGFLSAYAFVRRIYSAIKLD